MVRASIATSDLRAPEIGEEMGASRLPREFCDNAASYQYPAWLAGAANDSSPPGPDVQERDVNCME